MAGMDFLQLFSGSNRGTPVSASNPVPTTQVGADGVSNGLRTYQLASAQSLASGANTTPVTGVVGGSYIWNVVGTFSGGSAVALQTLASDGVTWMTVGSPVTASGNVGVVIGNNASVRLLGSVATTTSLSSSLS